MFHSRNDLLQQIFRAKPQTRGIDAGMAADILSSEHILVDQELYGTIQLTEAGRKRANEIYDRHVLIKEFLMTVLSLDARTAETDACRIEHIVSQTTIDRIRALLQEKR